LLTIALAGCVTYSLVKAEPRMIAGLYRLHPQIEWSSVERQGSEIWTVHGVMLEVIYLINGVEDQRAIFPPLTPLHRKAALVPFRYVRE
jgi:hypothetical protein